MIEQPKSDIKLVKPEVMGSVSHLPMKRFACTDYGNAERVHHRFGHLIKYVERKKQWYLWNGQYWKKASIHEIEQLIKRTIRLIIEEAVGLSEAERTALYKHAIVSEAQVRIRAALESLKSQQGVCIEPEKLDADIWLLNLLNGTLDLRTQAIREHRPEDYITRMIDINYDVSAECPLFITFLHRIFEGNQSLIRFVQRVFGYALCGDTSEQCFFIMVGDGGNGKSTLIGILLSILGPYAQQAPAELLILKTHPSISNEVAGLDGYRVAAVGEYDHTRLLDECKIKQLTGGDRVRARNMYQDFFEFRPQAKYFVLANQTPQIRGLDEGIWRRIMKIPFNIKIQDHERDKRLPHKLEAEKIGILNWVVQGFRDWQENGLSPPEIVIVESRKYRAESNVLNEFIDECCKRLEGAEVEATKIYEAYKDWASKHSKTQLTQKAFGSALARLGFESRKKSIYWWQGIQLLATEDVGTMG